VIRPSEIKSVEEIGTLENSPVKMIRTIGGLWVATGRPKGRREEEALAAGSHPAIVKHNVEKMFGASYQPMMAKSESSSLDPKVTEHTSQLSKALIDKGYTLFSVQAEGAIDFVLSKSGIEVLKHEAMIKGEGLEFQSMKPKAMEHAQEAIQNDATRSVIMAAIDKASELGKDQIVCKNVVYKVK
jgi:hypothetical protein